MFQHRSKRTEFRARRAYSVLELMLVLALIVILGAFAYPELRGPIARQRLKSAAEVIRGAWNNARSSAMTTGEIHLFRYESGSGLFQVQRWINADTSSSEGPSAAASTASDEQLSLPEEVEFLEGEQLDARASFEAQAMSGADTGSAPSVMFYPDGTTSTIELEIVNIYETRVRISMRGLTGVVSVSAPYESGDSQ
jgi:Tfp pilus assembly protein FimT